MTMQPIKNDQAVVPVVSTSPPVVARQALEKTSQPNGGIISSKTVGGDYLTGAVNASVSGTVKRLVAIREDMSLRSAQAVEVRTAIYIEKQLNEINQSIGMPVKNYPTFSAKDAKRKEFLMSIAGIRREIEAMTIPKPLSPMPVKTRGMWADLFDRLQAEKSSEGASTQIRYIYETVRSVQNGASQTSSASSMSPAILEQLNNETVAQLSSSSYPITANLVGALQNL